MSESVAKLKTTLAELEAELASLDELDTETRALLQQAARDIQQALVEQEPSEIETHSFVDRLRESAEDFESSHPTLFGIVSRTIDALGQMGI